MGGETMVYKLFLKFIIENVHMNRSPYLRNLHHI
jgi:hypothetical protein